jgi:hypothetical protein
MISYVGKPRPESQPWRNKPVIAYFHIVNGRDFKTWRVQITFPNLAAALARYEKACKRWTYRIGVTISSTE